MTPTSDVATNAARAACRRKMTDPVCPKTAAPMRRGVRPMALEYKGGRTIIEMSGWYCDASQESIHTGEDMKVSDRALNRLKAETEGLPLPEEIKRIRTKLGLTQEAAGELIGGGPCVFKKYEAGDLLPSRAISCALALLDHDPTRLSVFYARAHVL
jgi:HTH-type transcriptional regulator / antitoxin MqsA